MRTQAGCCGDTALRGGGVGEHVAADHVAYRVKWCGAGVDLAARIDPDRGGRRVRPPALSMPSLLDVGTLAGGHQHDVAVEARLDAFLVA